MVAASHFSQTHGKHFLIETETEDGYEEAADDLASEEGNSKGLAIFSTICITSLQALKLG